MKNLIATALLSFSLVSLVSCGPIETTSTKTSTTKTSTSRTTRSTSASSHGTGSLSHTTTSTNSTRNSTVFTGPTVYSSHHSNTSTWSTSSSPSSHTTTSINSNKKTTTSTSHSKSSSDLKKSSTSSRLPTISGHITKSANATETSKTSTSHSGSNSTHAESSASLSSQSVSGHITKSANTTQHSTTSISHTGSSSTHKESSTSSSSHSLSGRVTNSANATELTSSKSRSVSGHITKSTNATEKSTTSPNLSKSTSIANSSSTHNISSIAKDTQAKSSTPPQSSTPTSSALYSLKTFAGPEDGSAPPWNLNNVSCYELTFLNGSQQWAAVNGDSVVETFNEMYSGNKMMCSDCFGMTLGACTSKDITCEKGLKDLSAIANTTGQARWDTAAAIFAQDPDDTDLMCDIGTSECSSSPKCELLDGPGAWAILKSIETMYDMLENVYNSIQAAGDAAGHQMQAFSNTFAPVPSFKDDAIWLMVMIAIIGAIIGAVTGGMFMPEVFGIGIALEGAAAVAAPLVVSTAVGGISGVASAVGVNTFFFGMPAPGDTDSPLGTIISATLLTWSNFCDNLMADGSYVFAGDNGKDATTISMQNLMKNGALMQANNNISQGFVAMQPVMEVIMFQQLALYTWQNLQSTDVSSTPYIVYDNEPCDKLNVTYQYDYFSDGDVPVFGKDSILTYLPGIYTLDANMTYNGKCYWLLGAKPDGNRVFGKKVAPSFHCTGDRLLPGATNKDLKQNAGIFAGLGLQHWIIPSVLGWQQNHNQNGYQMASQLGQLVSDPLQPATVNIPVCEYIRNPQSPGVGCPKLNQHQTDACEVYPPSTGIDQPGAYNPGRCGVHIDQYQRNEPSQINPLNVFQLSVFIYDANGIQIGQASKQSAAHALAVVDSALPYNLIVFPGAGDDDPDRFWYSDQYWNSSSCSVGAYDNGVRQMDCGFNCPLPAATPPQSATIANPIPGGATAAAGGDKTFLNTWITATPTPTPTGPPPPPPSPTYATGQCGIHVVQYQKNEGDLNPTGNYLLEVTIFDGKQKPIGQSGQVPAPMGVPVNVPGLVSPFTITANATDNQPLVCEFQGRKFTLDQATCGQHAIGLYDSGSRNMDCGFPC